MACSAAFRRLSFDGAFQVEQFADAFQCLPGDGRVRRRIHVVELAPRLRPTGYLNHINDGGDHGGPRDFCNEVRSETERR